MSTFNATYPANFLDGQTYSGTALRQILDVLYPIEGVMAPGDLLATGSASALTVNVADGRVLVQGDDTPNQGKYQCEFYQSGGCTFTFVMPTTGQSRNDIIGVKVTDAAIVGGSSIPGQLQVITGTPATTGSQVDPTIPATFRSIARVRAVAGLTSLSTHVDDLRTFAYAMNQIPSGRLYSSSQTLVLTSGSSGTVPHNASQYLTGGMTVSGGALVVPVTGTYLCACRSVFQTGGSSPGAGRYQTTLYVNGSQVEVSEVYFPSGATGFPGPMLTTLTAVTAGQTIQSGAYQSSSISEGVGPAGSAYPFLEATLISP